jgi:hypothetical protein
VQNKFPLFVLLDLNSASIKHYFNGNKLTTLTTDKYSKFAHPTVTVLATSFDACGFLARSLFST